MKSLSFYEQQHLQQLLRQEGSVKYLFDRFVREAGPLLARWSDHGGDSVWVRNAPVERAIEKSLSELHDSLLNLVTDASIQAWNRGNKKVDDLVEGFIKDLSVSETLRDKLFSRNADALQAFLKWKDSEGLTLSDRVWNIAGGMKDNLEFYLSSGLSAGRPAALISQDVRQLLNEPGRRFHRVRDKEGKLVMSQPMKDYHPGRGVYRSAYKNALRLSATNTNRAYRSADYDRWQKMDFVLGIEIERSPSHRGSCPVCDAMAGKYPKGFKFTGWHPFCICMATPIMMDHEEFADFLLDDKLPAGKTIRTIPDGAKAYMADHPIMQQSFAFRDNSAYFAEDSLFSLLAKAGKLGIRTERYEQALARGQYPEMLTHALKTDIARKEEAVRQEEELYKVVESVENVIRMNAGFETSVVFDRNGRKLLEKRGLSRSVTFTVEECRCMKDAIVTHNHPSGWSYPENSIMRIGNSFSKEDLLLAVGNDMAETRVVTPNYTFIMKRPPNGWNISFDELKKEIKTLELAIYKEYRPLIYQGIISADQAVITHCHRVSKTLSKKYGWIYTKKKVVKPASGI